MTGFVLETVIILVGKADNAGGQDLPPLLYARFEEGGCYVRPSFRPSVSNILLSHLSQQPIMNHSPFKLNMVLWLLHVANRIHVRQLSTSCFTT